MVSRVLALVLLSQLAAPVLGQSPNTKAQRLPTQRQHPNIMFVVIDDMGYDLLNETCTPNLDRLSDMGMTLTRFYVNPVCSPTRACLMTGRYGFRTGVGQVLFPRSPFRLRLHEDIIPELLDPAYDHSAIGKWHLTGAIARYRQHPNLSGFNYYAGLLFNFHGDGVFQDYYDWTKVVNGEEIPVKRYATLVTTEDALERMRVMPEPWFLYVCYNAPHAPLEAAPPKLISCENHPVTEPQLTRNMLEAFDTDFARLLAALDDHTYLFVFADNGTARRAADTPGHAKGTQYEPSINVPLWIIGPGVPVMTVDQYVHAVDLMPTVVELSGAPPPLVDGVSIVPWLHGDVMPVRDFVYCEKFKPNGDPTTDVRFWYRSITNDRRWKLIRRSDCVLGRGCVDTDELYDLNSDPLEAHDLFPPQTPQERAEYADLTARLRELGTN